MYLAKRHEILKFINSINIHNKPNDNTSIKVKNKFGNSSNLQKWNLFTESITEPVVIFTELFSCRTHFQNTFPERV